MLSNPTGAPTKRDIETADDVRRLVDAFYARVRSDALLSEVFDDILRVDWEAHLPVMYRFWETVLFARPGYKGNPPAAHVRVNQAVRASRGTGVSEAHFERWLALFRSTTDELFAGPRASQATRGATRMAEHLMAAMSIKEPTGMPITHQRYSAHAEQPGHPSA